MGEVTTTRGARNDPRSCLLGHHLGPPRPATLVALGQPGRLLALDPGTERTAWIALDLSSRRPLGFGIQPNGELLERLRRGGRAFDLVVIERVESFGMAVGAEVFETVFWSGRFAEAVDPVPVERIGRKAVKVALCGDPRARDPNVRQALIDRYGGKTAAIGTMAAPGPLHGVARDVWAALAVGVAWLDGAARIDATANVTAPRGRPVAPTGEAGG
jgi:hypothetical protein